MLLHLMEAQNIHQKDLIGVINSDENIVFEVVDGKRHISKE